MAIPIKAILSVNTKAFTGGFKLASKVLGGFIKLTKVATLAVTGFVGTISALVVIQAKAIDRIGKISDVIGLSTDLVQKFGFAAEQAGVSFDQSSVALRRFSRRLGEAQKGTGELLPALRRLGINVKNADGSFKSAEEVLFEFADGIANTDDASQRLALAFKAFDSEGAELVKTLADGSSGLKEFFDQAEAYGLILDRETIRGTEEFNDALNLLVRTIDGQVKRVVASLAPALKSLTTDLADFIKDSADTAGGFENLAIVIRNQVVNGFIIFIKALKEITKLLFGVVNLVLRLRVSLSEKFGDPLDPLTGKLTQIRNLFDDINNVVTPVSNRKIAEVIEKVKELGFETKRYDEYRKNAGNRIPSLWGAGLEEAKQDIEEILKTLRKSVGTLPAELDFTGESFDAIIKRLEEILKTTNGTVERVKEFKVATTETNRELDLTLGYWERIGLKIKDFLTRDLPEAVKASTEAIKNTLKTVAERLAELSDPVKTIEDGLVKAGQAFEDALVDAIMTGKANFDDFKQLLKETFARAIVQKFITGPIFDLFKAKGGPVKAGQPYVVGEEGPELFVPGASGTIVPNHKMASPNAIQGGQPTQVIYNISAIDSASFEQRLAQNPEYLYNLTQVGARRQPA